jgi:hypothetical protein
LSRCRGGAEPQSRYYRDGIDVVQMSDVVQSRCKGGADVVHSSVEVQILRIRV